MAINREVNKNDKVNGVEQKWKRR